MANDSRIPSDAIEGWLNRFDDFFIDHSTLIVLEYQSSWHTGGGQYTIQGNFYEQIKDQ
jgi:hypothetical protein